mmetsp:Transcript_41938/g.100797  ORF Transcript_41938/g.100797 Transcript_41938/m.100797 type:complete len:326 (-) Transcript_41938:167-1144(-)
MVKVESRVVTTAMGRKDAKFIRDACSEIYMRCVFQTDADLKEKKDKKKLTKEEKHQDFVTSLKYVLDNRFQPHWHVVCGDKLGFACKYRLGQMIKIKLNDGSYDWSKSSQGGLLIVCYKSPGEEGVLTPLTEDQKKARKSQTVPKSFKVDSRPKAESAKYEEGVTDKAVETITTCLSEMSLEDEQFFATYLRRQLTEASSPVWHVLVGSDFYIAPAENVRSEIWASVGKVKLNVFRHEQVMAGQWNTAKIMQAVPYLIVIIACIAYIMRKGMCEDEAGYKPMMRVYLEGTAFQQSLCELKADSMTNCVVGALIGGVCLKQLQKYF